MITLISPKFWAVVCAGVLLLTPIENASLRRIALAAINALFLIFLMKTGSWPLFVGFGLAWVLLSAVGSTSIYGVAGFTLLLAALFLFVLHKLPGLAIAMHMTRVNPLLAGIGYAYVFLRLLDVLRAVWERRSKPPGPVVLFNYLLPFHMLAAGPIQSWDDYVAAPVIPPPLRASTGLMAMERIAKSLFKKAVLAPVIVGVISTHWRAPGWYRLLEMNACYLWLYLDFSAYSDLALGIGMLIGVETPVNFNRPYLARNITDFWERWHISLSLFIRRNLFFPIQLTLLRRFGGKYPIAVASFAIFVAFMLCGAWHGLTFPFLLWGLANSLGLVACNLYREALKRKLGAKGVKRYMQSLPVRIVSTVVTFEFVAFTIMLISEHGGSTW